MLYSSGPLGGPLCVNRCSDDSVVPNVCRGDLCQCNLYGEGGGVIDVLMS